MKKILGIIIISFFILIPKSYSKIIGEGELKLDDGMIRYFHQYLKGKGNQKPMMFTIAVDGSYASYWYCPASQCAGNNPAQYIKLCEIKGGIECKVFAKGRYIKWKNGINLGKGKASKVKSKQSFSDLKARLTELGFVGGSTSSSVNTTTKVAKKIKEGVVYFNKCASTYTDKEDYHDSFEIDLKKKIIKYEFFATGEIYKHKKKITLNNDDLIKTKIENYGDDSYVQYIFNKKDDEVTSFFFKDKKGKIKDNQYVLICDDIVGTLNNQKIKKKETKKIVKKYSESGERSIALSWDGYEDLIAGTVEFDEADYKGTLNIPLPNNDGNCDGSYSLQKGGKGTWQIACTNDMGAAGTLKWSESGGVTGIGRDHNDKKVKFTVSKKS